MLHMGFRIDRYEIKSLIAAGGMGSLYLARDTNPNTKRLVALKLLLASLDSAELRDRFAREARTLAALNHPNIVDIYDSGQFQGSPFIVMEYVRGETLAERIKRRAPMTLAQKLRLMTELCSGLHHAHELGVIHRDIKPANLMVDAHGRLKILDFGIARVSEKLTRTGMLPTQPSMRIGTPGYMSPEQIEGAEIDRRSDIFAVGAVGYELLTYRVAFTGASTRQIENSVVEATPQPLTALIPDLDPELQDIIGRALAKNPDDRYQDAASVEHAFDRLRWRLGPSEVLPPVPPPEIFRGASRQSRNSRVEAVYQRCLAVDAEGAHDAARRLAMEVLAEDPDHKGAREFMTRFSDDLRWLPAPLRSDTPHEPTEPTELATVGDVSTNPSRPRSPVSASGQRHRRFGKSWQVFTILLAVTTLVGSAALLALWLWPAGPTLTIDRPKGGTISGAAINCGTHTSDCVAEFRNGEDIDLRAEPDEGFVFSGFVGDCKPNGRTIMNKARRCGATFAKIPEAPATPMVQLTIALPSGGTLIGNGIRCGSLAGECTVEHPQGEVVRLKPLADADFTFKGFTGDCPRTGVVVMSTSRTCGALFMRDTRPVVKPDTPRPPPNLPSPNVGPVDANGGGAGPNLPSPPTPSPPSPHVDPLPAPKPPPEDPAGEGAKSAPPPAPPSPESLAKNAIQQLLEKYRRAYEERDIDAIQKVYPNAPSGFVKGLEYAFKEYKSLEYTYTGPLEFVHIDPALGTAKVKVVTLSKPEYRGPRSKPQTRINHFTLNRQSDTWSIVGIEVKAQ
jgi:serine/threonine protein kinase